MKLHLTSMGAKMAFSLFLIAGAMSSVNAQNVGINANGATPNASAILDVSSTDKGLLAPRMTQTQRNAITTPATGLLIFQTDNTPGFYYYNGSGWVQGVGATGAQGAAGATGAQGPAGPAGATGSTGLTGPAGTAGATGAQGIAGTTGQSSNNYYTNATLNIASGQGLYILPGFPVTITVPANSQTLVSYKLGGLGNCGAGRMDVALLVDGAVHPATYSSASLGNNNLTLFQQLSSTVVLNLSAGTHTISILAANSGLCGLAVGGNATDIRRGELNVTFIKQ